MSTGAAGRAERRRQAIRVEQGLAELLGLIRGVLADGSVSADEAERLAEWTHHHPEVAARWPVNLLHRRLERIFRDGRVDGRERRHLSAMVSDLADDPEGMGAGFPLATDLPLTRPEPEVTFAGKTFVFAGEAVYGPTHVCEREVLDLGGRCEGHVTRRTNYVVIGQIAAADWTQSTFGSVIDEVVQYRTRGVPIAVISEQRWIDALPPGGR